MRLAVLGAAAAVLTTGCEAREVYEDTFALGFPDPVTDQGERIYNLWLGSVVAGSVVALFVWGLIFFALVRYRRVGNELPRQVRYNLPIEVLYTAVPFVILAVLFFYTARDQTYVNKMTAKPDVTIGVVGFKWNWQFNYAGENLQVTGAPSEPAELVIPTNRTIRFIESSPDVIHSFYVPAFLFKRDVIPNQKDRLNQFEITVREEGRYIGRCAEFCGEKHSRMNFYVRVVSPEAYDAYIADLRRQPPAGTVQPAVAQPPRSTS